MGINKFYISAFSTVLSLVGLQWWTESKLCQLKLDGSIGMDAIYSGNASNVLQLFLGSHITILLLANFVFNIFVLGILCLKTIFFVQLYPSEVRKVVERLINYAIFKGAFLPLVIPPTVFQAGMWSTWLIVLCSLKMFEALARDRLERLNASPSATPLTYLRVFSVFLLVLSVDFFWIKLCITIFKTSHSTVFLLLFFEPLSIAFETLQAIVVHGFQLLDIWHRHSMESSTDCQRSQVFDRSAAVLFLTIRALASTTYKRIKGFVKLRTALSALHEALPDATSEEIEAYDDECAICKEPMAKAKKLSCNHLFHLACLRSWLDQGLSKIHPCPTCRRPLFAVRPEENTNHHTGEVTDNEQLARQISSGLERQNTSGHTLPVGAFSNMQQNPSESFAWRGVRLGSSWIQPRPSQSLDGAGPSTAIRSVGLSRVQMMMRHLEEAVWSLWPVTNPQAVPGSPVPPVPTTGGLSSRSASPLINDNISSIIAMADTVREVLPHIPHEIIFQDLWRTKSVAVTVNNLLRM